MAIPDGLLGHARIPVPARSRESASTADSHDFSRIFFFGDVDSLFRSTRTMGVLSLCAGLIKGASIAGITSLAAPASVAFQQLR